MKALTICQPFAHLIVLPSTHPEHKRVENRKWFWDHRGLLAIHAGKSEVWLEPDDREVFPDMAFGAVVGVVDMVDCIHVDRIPESFAWMRLHKHTEGPWCHVYANARRFRGPIPVSGQRGPWDWTPPENWQGLLEVVA